MAKENNNSNWLCLYIYINPPAEYLLVNCLSPVLEDLLGKALINNFFFIRYNDDGYHIRLRMHFKNLDSEETNEPVIIQKILYFIYLNNIPSSKTDGTYIISTIYEPEINRYGGIYGIKLAEKIFKDSSLTILNNIKQANGWNYKMALNNAIIMNYLMMNIFIPNNRILQNFFFINSKKWFPISTTKTEKEIQQYYQSQRNDFLQLNSEVYNLIENIYTDYLVKSNYKIWVKEIEKRRKELDKLIIAKKMIYIKSQDDSIYMQKIYESYVHMNNNRLGIKNSDESLVSYLIFNTIKIQNNG